MKSKQITGLQSDIDRLSVWAVRYALGRMTYAVHDVVEVLSRNVDALAPNTRQAIGEDIDDALAEGRAGMAMDVEQWKSLRDIFLRPPN